MRTAIAVVVTCALAPVGVQAGPRVTAKAAIITDSRTGAVLWEDHADVPLPPASTTKIVSAIVALESGRLGESMRVSPTAAATPASKLYLHAGQRMRLEHLVYAMLLNSANDAAVVVAEGLGGSQRAFGHQMTKKAKAMGAEHSRFLNPHGLTAPGHVATARDLAVMFRYGLGVPRFRDILSTRTIAVPLQSRRRKSVTLRSHNRLLQGYRYRVIGKTGYTRAAGRCFVGAASNGDREVIIAFLGSRNLWGDARSMIDWAFGPHAPETPDVQMVRREASPKEEPAPPTAKARAEVATPAKARAASVRTATAAAAPAPVAEGDVEEPEWSPGEPTKGAGRRFTVCLGPYGDAETAEQVRARLQKRGYGGLVSGNSLTLGSFSSRSRAANLATRLRGFGYDPVVVTVR